MKLTGGPCAPVAPVVPVAPVAPVGPAAPVGPGAPWGIVKLRTAALPVPEFVTLAAVPAAPVVVVPTATVWVPTATAQLQLDDAVLYLSTSPSAQA
ncbi:hypothetical protein FO488_14175 [Geobacter sp. FeAm09]|nr:hypothetical protein FO488_14175 [Geobacter sp. FeAm09]